MFKLRKDTYQYQTERAIITNSLTVKVGDVVAIVSDFATNASGSVAGDKYPIGVVVGFCTNTGGVYPTSGQDPTNTPNQVTVTSSNQTVAKVNAVFIPIFREQVWEADFSAARGTTSTSDENYTFFDLTDCRTIDETSVTQSATGAKQVVVVAPHESSTSKAYVRFSKAVFINR